MRVVVKTQMVHIILVYKVVSPSRGLSVLVKFVSSFI